MSYLPVRSWLSVAVLIAVAGCGSKQGGRPRLGEVDRLPHLETISPERCPHRTVVREYTATIASMEKADLCAQVRGLVGNLAEDIDIGRLVKKGEPLISLDVPDLVAERENKKALLQQGVNLKEQAAQAYQVAAEEIKEAEAQEKKQQAEVEYRELEYQRKTRLVADGTLQTQLAEESKLQLNTAHAALKTAHAQIETKKARLKAAEIETKVAESRVRVAQTELDRLEALVGFATIRAPFDGIITKRWVHRGATIKDPGMPLLTVKRDDKVRVILDIPERDVPLVRAAAGTGPNPGGNAVELRVPALRDISPGTEFKGTITLTSSSLDPVTRTMRVEVHLPNKEHHLKPQMTGTARLILEERKNVLTIPSSALVRLGDKMAIYCVVDVAGNPPRGTVKRMDVELGLDDGQCVEVSSMRLTGHELVITKGNGMVHEGDTVVPVPARQVECR